MHGFLYDYVKLKYREKAKLCYIDTYVFIVYIKQDIYVDIAKDVEGTSNYQLGRTLPRGKHKKSYCIIEDELSGKTIREFAVFRPETQLLNR